MSPAHLLRRWVAEEPGPAERLSWLLFPALFAALILRLALPHRPDWLGHFLAGFGATLGLLWALLLLAGARRGLVLVTTLVAIALGAGLESTSFALAGFDPLDFHAQSLGAGLAGLAMLHGGRDAPRHPLVPLTAAAATLAGGFFAFVA